MGGLELLGRELGVRGGGGVDDEGLGVAHVGQVREELHVVDDLQAGVAAALDAEDDDAAEAVLEDAGRGLVARVVLQAGVAHPADLGVALEELGHGQGVVAVALDAQGQRLDADADELGGVRGERGAKVTQLVGQNARGEGRGGSGIGEDGAVVGGVGLGDGGELARSLLPVELAGVHDSTAERGAVAADPLGQGLDDHRGTILGRTVKVRGGKGVVNEDRHRLLQGVGGRHDGGHVGDVNQRVADGLDVPELGVLLGGGHEGVDVVVLDEGGLDAQVTEGVQEDVPGAAVQGVGGDDVVAGAHDVGEGQDLRGVAGGDGDGALRALDGGHAGGHGVGGGVGQAAVDVAGLGQGKLGGAVLGGVKLEGGGGVDGQGSRAGRGVGRQAGVDLEGVKVLGGVLCEGGIKLKRHDGFSFVVERSCGARRCHAGGLSASSHFGLMILVRLAGRRLNARGQSGA